MQGNRLEVGRLTELQQEVGCACRLLRGSALQPHVRVLLGAEQHEIRLDQCRRSASGGYWLSCELLGHAAPLCLLREPLAVAWADVCAADSSRQRLLSAAALHLDAADETLLRCAAAQRAQGGALAESWAMCRRALPLPRLAALLRAARPSAALRKQHVGAVAAARPAEAALQRAVQQQRECCVCLEMLVDQGVLLYPCGHAQYCAECATRIDKCAICRGKIRDRVNVH